MEEVLFVYCSSTNAVVEILKNTGYLHISVVNKTSITQDSDETKRSCNSFTGSYMGCFLTKCILQCMDIPQREIFLTWKYFPPFLYKTSLKGKNLLLRANSSLQL